MATLHSFYLLPESWREPFSLDAAESHHLVRVLRLKPGAQVRLFDGRGRHGLFRVATAAKSGVLLEQESEAFEREPSVRCTLAAGFSKALRRGWFMEKAVELEASSLWFWQGEHSHASLPEAEKDSWKASLIAGAKQCRSAWLPEFSLIKGGVRGLVARRDEFDRALLLYEGDTGGRLVRREDLSAPGSLLLVVGPEGGFSANEAVVLQEAGVEAVSLGKRVLRWETAAVLTLGMAWWARQG
ncbi:MAG: 16S rRNA (uracil(1498)-N(3))-methyltransferase [Desulfovibrionaceae bacterium]|nr:16S rRNA (uracil(1498)-N(3))-methyltransferase [Desulfovibrionaceae bacterium]